MIVSASRRTDIPAFYSRWFFNRLREGYVLVRNPAAPRRISRISLGPEDVDGIVFWTKNPAPMLDKLDLLREYAYYFQFTLTPYGREVESGLPSKNRVILPAFQRLADKIGPERVIWRYDPIFLSRTYTMEYHLRAFEKLTRRLAPFTNKCIISFLDYYHDTARKMADLELLPFPPALQRQLAARMAEIARSQGLQLETCAEAMDLQDLGIGHARCVDARLLGKLLDCELEVGKDKQQRPACGCAESADIGAYGSCPGGCRYCYAGPWTGFSAHDPASPLLLGQVGPEDVIVPRASRSLRSGQLRFDI